MATEDELRDLSEKIGRLSMDDRLHLLEVVLAGMRAERTVDEDAARRELAAWEQWHLQRQRPATPVEEHAREAG